MTKKLDQACCPVEDLCVRLDAAMAARGLARSRSQASDWIRRGFVEVNGRLASKPGLAVAKRDTITLAQDTPRHLSRGAEKLAAAIAHFGYSPAVRTALDVGASTGGFTEILLAAGASRVFAVDVGRDQLHFALRSDPRVNVLEGLDTRLLERAHVPVPVEAITADLSFISLRKALDAALALAAPDCWLIALVKPQFEAGLEHVGKGGIVRDPRAREHACLAVAKWLETSHGWHVDGCIPSPVAGRDGNVEFLLGARR